MLQLQGTGWQVAKNQRNSCFGSGCADYACKIGAKMKNGQILPSLRPFFAAGTQFFRYFRGLLGNPKIFCR
jgi:hypothetical protein